MPRNWQSQPARSLRKIKRLTGKATWFTKTKSKEDQIQVKMPPQKTFKRKPPNEPTNNTEVPPETVLFVPYTPRSELKKDIMKAEQNMARSSYGRVKIVETIRPKLNQMLSNTAPWRNKHCGREECVTCPTKPGQCLARNVTYKVEDGTRESHG